MPIITTVERLTLITDTRLTPNSAGMCFDRNVEFESAHRSHLFDASTGEKVDLTGGFGFTTEASQARSFW